MAIPPLTPAPADFNLDKVLQHWDNAMKCIRKARIYGAEGKEKDARDSVNSAGHALSSAIEYAIKLHMQKNWSLMTDAQNRRLYSSFRLPGAIQRLYEENGNPRLLYSLTFDGTPPSVDFQYLEAERDSFSNNTAHKGIDLLMADITTAATKIEEFINTYLTTDSLKKPEDFDIKSEALANYYADCDGFRGNDSIYILINDPSHPNSKEALTRVDWTAVIDFDENTFEPEGLGATYGLNNLHTVIKSDDLLSSASLGKIPGNPIFYVADGWKGRVQVSISEEDWKRHRQRAAAKFIEKLFDEVVTGGYQKVYVLSLLSSRQKNAFISGQMETMGAHLGKIHYGIIEDGLKGWVESQDNPNLEYLPFSKGELADLLRTQLPERVGVPTETYELPFRKEDSKASGIIPSERVHVLKEYLDILFIDKARHDVENSSSEQLRFYKGEIPLPWAGTYHHWGVERRWLDQLRRTLLGWIKDTAPYDGKRICRISHYPGDGGTSIVRQAAFQIHRDYPVVFLKKYHATRIPAMLEELYDKVHLPLVVFIEVPETMSTAEVAHLASSLNPTKPILLIAIGRNGFDHAIARYTDIPDWGKDFTKLADFYAEIGVEHGLHTDKKALVNKIHENCPNRHKTPFEAALTVFEKDYQGIGKFVEKFYSQVKANRAQCTTLSLLALLDTYHRPWMPSMPFRSVFQLPEGTVFLLEEKFPSELTESLLKKKDDNGKILYAIRHPLLSEEILRQFNGMDREDDSFKKNLLPLLCEFIDMCAETEDAFFEEKVIELCIDREKDEQGKQQTYSPAVTDLADDEKILLFRHLVEKYPHNPHFNAHLARGLVKINHAFKEALKYIEKAIEYSPEPDPVLFHIKGECIRNTLFALPDPTKGQDFQEDEEMRGWSLDRLVSEGGDAYLKCMEYGKGSVLMYGYDGYLSLLIRALEYEKKRSGDNWRTVLSREPYSGWLEKASDLLDELHYVEMGEDEENRKYSRHLVGIQKVIDDYSGAIQYLDNKLATAGSDSVRRLLVGCYLSRDYTERDSYKDNPKVNKRLREIMAVNLMGNRPTQGDFFKWLELVRYSDLTIEECAATVRQWTVNSNLPVVHFYNYVFQTELALDNNIQAIRYARQALDECKKLRPNDIRIREWLGSECERMKNSLVRPDEKNHTALGVIEGYAEYNNPGDGSITIPDLDLDQKIFFNPRKNNMDESCHNKKVEFCLGFSYDGLRAEEVNIIH